MVVVHADKAKTARTINNGLDARIFDTVISISFLTELKHVAFQLGFISGKWFWRVKYPVAWIAVGESVKKQKIYTIIQGLISHYQRRITR